jgi:hypothetical protein
MVRCNDQAQMDGEWREKGLCDVKMDEDREQASGCR